MVLATSQSANALFLYRNTLLVSDDAIDKRVVRINPVTDAVVQIIEGPGYADPGGLDPATTSLTDVQVDPLTGNIFVGVNIDIGLPTATGTVDVFDPFGTYIRTIVLPADPGPDTYPFGIDIDTDGSVWAARPNSNQVVRVANDGTNTVLGQFDVSAVITRPSDVVVGDDPAVFGGDRVIFISGRDGNVATLRPGVPPAADVLAPFATATGNGVAPAPEVLSVELPADPFLPAGTPRETTVRITTSEHTVEHYNSLTGALVAPGVVAQAIAGPLQDSAQLFPAPPDNIVANQLFFATDPNNGVVERYTAGGAPAGGLTGGGALVLPSGIAAAVNPASSLRYQFDPLFGTACAGDTVPPHALTITNESASPITINTVDFAAATTDFTIDANPARPVLLQPGAHVSFNVRFIPNGAGGPKTATVRVISTDPVAPLVTFPVLGTVLVPDINTSPGAVLNFGDVCVGDEETQDVEIRNQGGCPLTINVLSLAGPDFVGVTNFPALPLVIDAGESSIIRISFRPLAGAFGARNGTLTISSNDPDEANYVVSVVGNVPPPDIAASPAAVDFGNVCQGVATASEVQILNEGPCALTVTGLTLGGANAADFAVQLPTLPLNIPAGSSVTVPVRVTASAQGARTATLSVASNDPDENPLVINLTATAAPPDINASPATVAFGDVCLGDSKTLTVEILNQGGCALNISALTLASGAQGFTVAGPGTPLILDAGESAPISVTFTPTGAFGARADTLQIASNDPDEPLFAVPLTGNVPPPDINVAPQSVNFGDVCLGDSKTLNVVVSNQGGCDLNITSAMLLAGSNADFSVSAPQLPLVINSGSDAIIQVTLTPTVANGTPPGGFGARTGTLVLGSNDPDENPLNVALAGNVPPPDINVSPTALAFGDLCIGDTATLPLEISNQGDCDLTITSIALGPGSSPDFGLLLPQFPLIIAAGEHRTIQVTFTPSGMFGPRTGTVVITSNDPDENPLVVNITGNVPPPDIAASPAALDFGNVCIGVRETRNVQILNEGGCDLTLSNFTLGGANPGDYDVDPPTLPLVLKPGTGVIVPVHVAATVLGARNATLSVASNDPDAAESPLVIPLTAVAVPADINVSPQSVNFGDVCLGDSKTLNVTVSNQGGCDLTISTVGLVAGSNGDFSVSAPQLPIVLPRGDTAIVQVTLTPTVANGTPPFGFGARVGTLRFGSDDPNENPLDVSLTGNVPPPDINVAPQSLAFGNVCLGETKTLNATISNQGGCDLNITAIALAGGSNGDYSISAPQLPITLVPGATTIVQVTLTPTAANGPAPFGYGPRNGTLSVTSNDPDGAENPLLVSLTGTVPPPDINVSPTALDFGEVCVGDRKTLDAEISNQGLCDLTVSSLNTSGVGFSVQRPQLPVIIPKGGRITVRVTYLGTLPFNPPGSKSGTLSIVSDDPDVTENPLVVPLTAVVPPPDIQVEPTELLFGDVCIGDSKVLDLRVANQGKCDLTITDIQNLDPAPAGSFTIQEPQLPLILKPGQAAAIHVVFAPNPTFGPKTGAVRFINNDPDEGNLVVPLSGNAPPPDIAASPSSIDFQNVCVGVPVTRNLEIANTGKCDLNVTGITRTAGSTDFSVAPPTLPFVVKSGGNVTVPITVNATSFGARSATFSIASDDPDENPLNVTVAATAAPPDINITPSTVNLGDVCIGDSVTKDVTIRNQGGCDLTIGSITVAGAGYSIVTPATPIVLAAGETATVQVTLTPTGDFGTKTGLLSINSNDPDSPLVTVALTGNAPAPDIAVSPTNVSFGNVCQGEPATRNVEILNTGGCDLTITAITRVAGTSDFSVSLPSLPLVLVSGAKVTVPITVNATVQGARNAEFRISSNDPDENPISVFVAATSVAPDIAIQGSPVDFGRVPMTDAAAHEKTFQIINQGGCDLVVSSIAFSPATTEFVIVDPAVDPSRPLRVKAGETLPVTVRFTPTSAGVKTASIVVLTNDPDSPSVTVPVTAETETGTVGSLSLPEGLAFPPTVTRNFGEFFSELPATIGNNGSGTLRINNIALTGAGAGDYRLVGLPAFPILLNSGDTVGQGDFRVQFRPTRVARHIEADLVITVADPVNGQVIGTETVPLCGEGVAPGSRLLVNVGGAPSPVVKTIELQRQNKAKFQNVISFRNVAPRAKNGNPPCPAFTFHVEVGGADSPAKVTFLRPGTYRWVVTQRVGNRNVKKTVPFRVENGTFQDVAVDF
jgi:hypothetical protein